MTIVSSTPVPCSRRSAIYALNKRKNSSDSNSPIPASILRTYPAKISHSTVFCLSLVTNQVQELTPLSRVSCRVASPHVSSDSEDSWQQTELIAFSRSRQYCSHFSTTSSPDLQEAIDRQTITQAKARRCNLVPFGNHFHAITCSQARMFAIATFSRYVQGPSRGDLLTAGWNASSQPGYWWIITFQQKWCPFEEFKFPKSARIKLSVTGWKCQSRLTLENRQRGSLALDSTVHLVRLEIRGSITFGVKFLSYIESK